MSEVLAGAGGTAALASLLYWLSRPAAVPALPPPRVEHVAPSLVCPVPVCPAPVCPAPQRLEGPYLLALSPALSSLLLWLVRRRCTRRSSRSVGVQASPSPGAARFAELGGQTLSILDLDAAPVPSPAPGRYGRRA